MKIESNFPKCPTCRGDVLPFSQSVVDEENGRLVVLTLGACDSCGNQYEYYEHYSYCGHTELNKTKIGAKAV